MVQKSPAEMDAILDKVMHASMQGRTAYVMPFCMGPLGSSFSKIGVQITDSPYVVANMRV
jgi:phosphoenolpyruvate carboxykinase (GTP)